MIATETGYFTSPDDLIAKVEAFAINPAKGGWTLNLSTAEGAGRRLHIQKSVDGTDYFLNFRSMNDEPVPGNPWTTVTYTSLMAIPSTGFDSGELSFDQPGGHPRIIGVPVGGCINVATSSRWYRFTSADNSLVVTVEDEWGTIQHAVCTQSATCLSVLCSSCFRRDHEQHNRTWLLRNRSNIRNYGCLVNIGGDSWSHLLDYQAYDDTSLRPVFNNYTHSGAYYGLAPEVLNHSVNANIGIPALIPFSLCRANPSNWCTIFDGVPDIAFINKKYLGEGQEIVIGGKTWIVYSANYDDTDKGFAFRIA